MRAAVSAFCSLTRPTRREVQQLDDLAMPLYDQVSEETRRYMAAALSECELAPLMLVRRLCDEKVELAAPLLMRSPLLREIDLVALIGRHGLPHARVIAHRPNLDATIAALIRALETTPLKDVTAVREPVSHRRPEPAASSTPTPAAPPAKSDAAAEETRDRLRSMMRPAGKRRTEDSPPPEEPVAIHWPSHPGLFEKLRSTALTGAPALFQTALADVLGIGFMQARSITETQDDRHLILALRSLDIGSSDAYLLAAACFPSRYPHPEAIRRFLESYELTHREQARDAVRGWKSATIGEKALKTATPEAAGAPNREPGPGTPANSGGESRLLRAS